MFSSEPALRVFRLRCFEERQLRGSFQKRLCLIEKQLLRGFLFRITFRTARFHLSPPFVIAACKQFYVALCGRLRSAVHGRFHIALSEKREFFFATFRDFLSPLRSLIDSILEKLMLRVHSGSGCFPESGNTQRKQRKVFGCLFSLPCIALHCIAEERDRERRKNSGLSGFR